MLLSERECEGWWRDGVGEKSPWDDTGVLLAVRRGSELECGRPGGGGCSGLLNWFIGESMVRWNLIES